MEGLLSTGPTPSSLMTSCLSLRLGGAVKAVEDEDDLVKESVNELRPSL